MIYDYQIDDMSEPAFLDWQKNSSGFFVEFTKNNRKYRATLIALEKSWKLKLYRIDDEKTIIELRFRNIAMDDALFKSETYIMEYAE